MKISDEMSVVCFILVATMASFYRAATINHGEYQKNEDAYFPIRRKRFMHEKIIRERTIWECGGILLNAIVFIVIMYIKKRNLGNSNFLFTKRFIAWYVYTAFQVLFWDVGVFVYLKIASKKKQRIILPESPKDKSIFELEKTAEYYASIYDPIDDSNIYVLNAYKPIYCLRDKGDYYRVAYFNEILNDHQSIVLYFFDKNGQKLLYEEVYEPFLEKDAFLELQPGTSITAVKEMDPKGIYSGFQQSSTDKRSLHIAKNGYIIEIHYDYFSRIQEVLCELV